MPYILQRKPYTDAFWVKNKESGHKFSKDPLPLSRAKAQLRALYAHENTLSGGGKIDYAKAAYIKEAPQYIDDSELVFSSPTMKIYRHGKHMTVAVRGTTDISDMITGFALAHSSSLATLTPRVQKDISDLKAFQVMYPQSEYTYSGVGHSLGGFVMDAMLAEGLIKHADSYNPAIARDLIVNPDTRNKRIYHEKDPLYMINKLAGLQSPVSVTPGPETGLQAHTIHAPSLSAKLNKTQDAAPEGRS